MAHDLTPKVRGIRESVKATIIKEMVNTQNKIINLPAGQDPKPLFDIKLGLLDQLMRVSEKAITDLNDSPALAGLIAALDGAAAEAKREAERLSSAARKVSEFAGMLGRIEGIVGKILDIAH